MPQATTIQVPVVASQRYMGRWDLWINSFLHIAVMNVLNSLASTELDTDTESAGGVMVSKTTSRAAFERLRGNVALLQRLVLDVWKDDIYRGQERQKVDDQYDPFEQFGYVWALFARKGYLRLLPQRTLVK